MSKGKVNASQPTLFPWVSPVAQDRQALSDAASKADSGPVGTGLCHEGAAVKRANIAQGSGAALCG